MQQLAKYFQCQGCGDRFEYACRRQPKYCGECRRIKHYANIQRYKKRKRKELKKGDREEKFSGKSGFLAQVGGASHAEIGRVLDLSNEQVEDTERRVLMKIRNNPELKDLWVTLKEELSEGALIRVSGPLAATEKADILLDYQLELARWWRLYERLMDAECWEEAADCLLTIEQFRTALESGHISLLTATHCVRATVGEDGDGDEPSPPRGGAEHLKI